jgi:hypothetical protein
MDQHTREPDTRFLGELTLASLLKRLPFEIFRLGLKEHDDNYQLGWRLVKPNEPIVVSFRKLRFATAEGINLAAVLREALGGNTEKGLVRFVFDEASSGLANALAEGSLSPTSGVQPLTHISMQAWSCGPFICDVNKENEVVDAARKIAESAMLVAAEWTTDQQSTFHDAIERIALEALFNIHEHAFDRASQFRRAFICLTVQPANRCLGGKDAHAPSERIWLEEQGNRLVFELAISDAGKGVPRTLWPTAKKRDPELFNAIHGHGSGTFAFDLQRALLHEHLAADSFRHDSSCKEDADFADEYHAMNWRGLYRCRQQVADFGGFIAIASGRGRAGFANLRGGSSDFSYALPKGNDIPGTTVVVRVALPLTYCGASLHPRPATDEERLTASVISPQIFPWMYMQSKRSVKTRIILPTHNELPVVGLIFSFCRISSDNQLLLRTSRVMEVTKLLAGLKQLPPNIVPILFFADIGSDTLLRAIAPSWTPLAGYPRLTAFWQPQQSQLAWRITGVFHADTETMLRDLEYQGRFEIPADSPDSVFTLAQELAINYPYFVSLDRTKWVVQLTQFAARIPQAIEYKAFELAFTEYWPEIRERVVTEDPQRNVLLITGTRVSRYVCMLSIVESSVQLAESLGQQLFLVLNGSNNGTRCHLVTDDHGSAFVAQTVLGYNPNKIFPIRREQALELPVASEVIVFVDAIFKGRTVGSLAEVLQERGLIVRGIVTCADFRNEPGTTIGNGVSVKSLLKIPHDSRPVEIDPAIPSGGEIQIDRVTHMPVDAEASRFVNLFTTERAKKIMDIDPCLFDHGFHEKGGRLHTITMPSERLLRRHLVEMINCLTDKLEKFLTTQVTPATDIVFFYRSDNEIGKHVDILHDQLVARRLIGLGHSFKVSIPIDHRTAKSVFAHADLGLLINCKPVEAGQLSLRVSNDSNNFPRDQFIAIFLDDAAVSGKSLRSFLHRVMRESSLQPRAVMAIVLVNRLSPAELRSFDLWRRLWSPISDGTGPGVPFCFDGVFRLQVRSQVGGSALSHPLLRRVRQGGPIPVKELRIFLQNLVSRANDGNLLRHIFVPESDVGSEQPLSNYAALLRHLLSLHQQNESVPAEILTTFLRLRNSHDSGLLHLLALEPELLDEVPFNGICRQDTIDRCVEALCDTNASRADKSDALTVLAWFETAFFEKLREIVPGLLRDESLRHQFLLFALTLFSRTYDQYHRVITALTDVKEPEDDCAWAVITRDLITRSHRFRQTIARIQTEMDAELLISDLVGRMSRHSPVAEQHWESLSNQLRTMYADWDFFADESACVHVLHNMEFTIALAKDVFLPALIGLIYLSELRGNDKLSEIMRNAHEDASLYVATLGAIAPRTLENVTREVVGKLHETLDALRSVTWAGGCSANDVLSHDDLSTGLSPLCMGLREFYSAPWAIISRLADEARHAQRKPRISGQVESHVLVCPVPIVEMREILRPLIENVIRHGDIGTLALSKTEGVPSLVICLHNMVRQSDSYGGIGIALAKARAAPFNVIVRSSVSDLDPRTWVTEIQFSHYFRADGIHV